MLHGRRGPVALAIVAACALAHADARDADALFAEARAAEDVQLDPARALALYEQIVRDRPDARAAVAAKRRADALRALVGAHGEHAREAAELAHLVADADRAAPAELARRADALADAAWPGAPEAASWYAAHLRERGDLAGARARFERLAARWPATPYASAALRGAAGCALDVGDWAGAEQLARAFPDDEHGARDEVLAAAARGRLRDRLGVAAWIALVLAFAALAASLLEAARGVRPRRAMLRPPVEVLFLAPVAALLVVVSFTAHRTIAPAVARISIVGVALAWLSGGALELARARGRAVRLRAIGHVAACVVGVAAIGYIAMTRDGLYDLLVDTVRFGPEP